jgi:hypothetical protein
MSSNCTTPVEVFYIGRREGVKKKTLHVYQNVETEARYHFDKPIGGTAKIIGARYRLMTDGNDHFSQVHDLLAQPEKDQGLVNIWIVEDETHVEKLALARQIKALTDEQLLSMTLQEIVSAASVFNRGDRALLLARIARRII